MENTSKTLSKWLKYDIERIAKTGHSSCLVSACVCVSAFMSCVSLDKSYGQQLCSHMKKKTRKIRINKKSARQNWTKPSIKFEMRNRSFESGFFLCVALLRTHCSNIFVAKTYFHAPVWRGNRKFTSISLEATCINSTLVGFGIGFLLRFGKNLVHIIILIWCSWCCL